MKKLMTLMSKLRHKSLQDNRGSKPKRRGRGFPNVANLDFPEVKKADFGIIENVDLLCKSKLET